MIYHFIQDYLNRCFIKDKILNSSLFDSRRMRHRLEQPSFQHTRDKINVTNLTNVHKMSNPTRRRRAPSASLEHAAQLHTCQKTDHHSANSAQKNNDQIKKRAQPNQSELPQQGGVNSAEDTVSVGELLFSSSFKGIVHRSEAK